MIDYNAQLLTVSGAPTLFEWTIQGDYSASNGRIIPIRNVFHFMDATQGPANVDVGTLDGALWGILVAPLKGITGPAMVWKSTLTRVLNDPTDVGVTVSHTATGTVTGDSQPIMVAGVVRLQTAGRGRSFMGSKHFGPVPESLTTLDELNSTGIASFTAVITALDQTLQSGGGVSDGGDGASSVVLSKTLSTFPPLTPPTITANWVTVFSLNKPLGTMKRRKETRHVEANF